MNSLLATWYNDVAIGVSIESLQARAKAIDAILNEVDGVQVLGLIALAHEQPVSGIEEWFRNFFHAEDASFLMRGNEREVALLAGACLVDLCKRDDDLAVLAAVAAAVAAQHGWVSLVRELHALAEQRLADVGASRRQIESMPERVGKPFWTTSLQAAIAKDFEGVGATPEAVTQAIGRVAAAANSAIEAVANETDMVARWAQRSLDILGEESQLLAWLLAGHSKTLGVSWASLDKATAAAVAARELIDVIAVVPAPPQADALIDQLLASTPFSTSPATTAAMPPVRCARGAELPDRVAAAKRGPSGRWTVEPPASATPSCLGRAVSVGPAERLADDDEEDDFHDVEADDTLAGRGCRRRQRSDGS